MKETRSYEQMNNRSFGEKVVVDLELDKKFSLKPIPKEVKNKAISGSVDFICKKHNIKYDYDVLNKTNTITIFGFPKDNSVVDLEQFLTKINEHLIFNLSDTIESELKESAKKYYRTCTLFESTVQNDTITLIWS